MNKLLRILTAIFAVATAILGFASYAEALPKEYAAVVGLVTAVLLGIKEIVVVIGDIADDGLRNHSFQPDARKVLSVLLLVGFCLSSIGCSQLKAFVIRHEATIEEAVVYGARVGVREGVKRLKRDSKQPVNVQPVRSGDESSPLPNDAPACEEPRGEALPACLKLTPSITIPRYGIQVAAVLKTNPRGGDAEAASSGQSRACGLLNHSPLRGAASANVNLTALALVAR